MIIICYARSSSNHQPPAMPEVFSHRVSAVATDGGWATDGALSSLQTLTHCPTDYHLTQTCKKSRPVRPAVEGNCHILGKFGEILHFPIRELSYFPIKKFPIWEISDVPSGETPI